MRKLSRTLQGWSSSRTLEAGLRSKMEGSGWTQSGMPIPPSSTELARSVVSLRGTSPFWAVRLVLFRPSQLHISYPYNCKMRLGMPSFRGVLFKLSEIAFLRLVSPEPVTGALSLRCLFISADQRHQRRCSEIGVMLSGKLLCTNPNTYLFDLLTLAVLGRLNGRVSQNRRDRLKSFKQ